MEGLDTHATRSYLKFSSCISEFSLNGVSICIQLPQHLQKNSSLPTQKLCPRNQRSLHYYGMNAHMLPKKKHLSRLYQMKIFGTTYMALTHPPSLTHSLTHPSTSVIQTLHCAVSNAVILLMGFLSNAAHVL